MDYSASTRQYRIYGDKLDILAWQEVLGAACRLGIITKEKHERTSFTVEDTYAATVLASGHLLTSDKTGRRLVACAGLLPEINHIPLADTASRAEPECSPGTTSEQTITPYRSKYHDGWRLLPLGLLHIDTNEFMCRNSEGKGIARLWLVSLEASRNIQLIFFTSLRGYEREARTYFRFFRHSAGLLPSSACGYPFHAVLGLREPTQSDPAKVTIESAAKTLRYYMQTYATEAFWQIKGIINDTDPECLHKYRVELRKMRSLISLLKPLLTGYHLELKSVLNTLMTRTNTLRDLDVLLASRNTYARIAESGEATPSMVEPDAGKGHKALFKRIAAVRAAEHASIAKWFESGESQKYTRRTLELLESHSPIWRWPVQKTAMPTIIARRILKAYAKVKAATLSLSTTASHADIHRLRILHKRLRYLLDFSLDLQADPTALALLGIMKNSQKHLGNYNDAEVQLAWFKSWNENLGEELTLPEKKAMALLGKTIENRIVEQRKLAVEHASECIGADTESLIVNFANRKEPS